MMLFCAILVAYLVGSVPTGLILASYFSEVDVRRQGSGNIGATNLYRLTGRKLGVLTLVGDGLKGALMVVVALSLFDGRAAPVGMTALAVFLGHCYSIYLGFRGGKGVATAAGVALVLTPFACLLAAGLWVATVLRWKRSSVGALIASAALPLLVMAFPSYRQHLALIVALVAIIVWRHKENLDRLLSGSEPTTTRLPQESG